MDNEIIDGLDNPRPKIHAAHYDRDGKYNVYSSFDNYDADINYDTVGFGQSDDHRYAFMNSKINQPIDKWKVDERCISLDSWFANSEFNQPLNNWKLTKLSYIDGIFFRSKYNHPLDKWFSKPITLYAMLAFAESECHQDLSMWKVNPDSVCDSMFYKSKYTIEEVSAWSWVKGLNQPVEDLFRLTMNSKIFYSWLFTNIDLAYKMNNEITVKYFDKNGRFKNHHDDYYTVYKNIDELVTALASGEMEYDRVVVITTRCDIQLIYDKLGHDFFGDDAIIFSGNKQYTIYPNMDALLTKCDEDDYFIASHTLSHLCSIEGPLDEDMLFSADGFICVLDGEFDKQTYLDVNINYPTVGFGEGDDHRYVFMNSSINQPIDKWLVDEKCISLVAWFANSLFNQPLNNWKLTKLDDIGAIFFRSKYNHPLDKWFSKPITISAVLAFAESECHQDLSMWCINPDSKCDGMFYNSKYTIEEVSTWSWVKNLNQDVEDLFSLTDRARYSYDWILNAIED